MGAASTITLRREAYSAKDGIGGLVQDGASHDYCSFGECLGDMVDACSVVDWDDAARTYYYLLRPALSQ